MHARGPVILFGAGASAFSPGIAPAPPPLGKRVFAALDEAFPIWRTLWWADRARFANDFEEGMRSLWALYPLAGQESTDGVPSPHLVMKDVARLFLRYTRDGSCTDLYTRFFARLRDGQKIHRVHLTTLNYETLAEQALLGLGLAPAVSRPHGGCRLWAVPMRVFCLAGALGAGMHARAKRVKQVAAATAAQRLNIPFQGMYPCMAIYMPGQFTQMAQEFLRRTQHRLARRIMTTRTVALVGVRPWPDDSHIWGPVAATDAAVLFVGGRAEFEVWKSRHRAGKPTRWLGPTFAGSLEDLADRL